jgi:hypothetical protein
MLLFRHVSWAFAALVLAAPAHATSLVPIPLEPVSHRLIVSIPSPDGTAETSGPGAPEVVFPFLIENDRWTGSGVATASVVGHRIAADLDGSLVPMPGVTERGSLRITLRSDVRMTIPDFGFPTTSVVLRVPALDVVFDGGFQYALAFVEPPASYASEIIGARVVTPPFGTEFGEEIEPTEAVVGSFLAGDVVEIRVELRLTVSEDFDLFGVGGTADGATVVELLAVPEPPLAPLSLLALATVAPALRRSAGRARRRGAAGPAPGPGSGGGDANVV